MRTRVKAARKALGLTQNAMAERMGLNGNYIYQIEAGKQAVSNRFASDLCRIFNVNEVWLRTGEGEMFVEVDPENQLMEWAGRVLASSSDSFRSRFVRMMMGLTDAEWMALEAKARQLFDEKKGDG